MDHFRQMNIARRDKEAELMDAYQEGYESNKRAVEESLKHERAAGKEQFQNKSKPNRTLLEQLSIAVAESAEYLHFMTRAGSNPLETKQSKVSFPRIDLSNARITVWARKMARSRAARREQASLRPPRSNESCHSQNYTNFELEQAEYSESEECDECMLQTPSSSYQTVERYPPITRVSEREEVSVSGPNRTKHQEPPFELSRTYTPRNTWR
jgi:hypothetical protein